MEEDIEVQARKDDESSTKGIDSIIEAAANIDIENEVHKDKILLTHQLPEINTSSNKNEGTNLTINMHAVSGICNTVGANKIKLTGYSHVTNVIQKNQIPDDQHLPEQWNVPPKNNNFTGRITLLENIEHYFRQTDTPIILTACNGLGGIGKTQLALEFVWQHYKKYKGVVWFDAETSQQLMNTYIRLGRKLKIIGDDEKDDQKELCLRVKEWLEDDERSGWLLVYDNAPDYESIVEFIPMKEGKLLVTSRYSAGWPHQNIIVDVFTIDESRAYIQKVLGNNLPENELDELAELVDRLPLALAIACAYIRMNKMKISRYMKAYDERKKDILSKRKSLLSDQLLEDSNKECRFTSVYITWDITTNKIREASLLAFNLLDACACLASNDIPLYLLETFAGFSDNSSDKPEIFEESIGRLDRYSMVTINEKLENLSIHPLVQEVIKLKWQDEDKEKNFSNVCRLLKISVPYGHDKLEDLRKMRQLSPHMEKLLQNLEAWQNKKSKHVSESKRIRAEKRCDSIMSLLGYCYLSLGDAKKAKEMLGRALPIKERHYGPDHPSVATTLSNLGNAYRDLGNYQKACEVLERALPIKERHYGPDHPSVATTLSNLGAVYSNLGNYQKACEVLERALPIDERHYGPDHPSVATTLSNLGNAYGDLGNYQKACEVLERALPIKERHYGPDHPSVATTLSNLGNAYGDLGNYQKACEVLERALPIDERHYGPDHPSVATTLSNLGNAYGDLGNYQKACEVLERALPIKERHYGPDHPSVATTLSNLGNAYGDLGNYQIACEVLERALPIKERHYGPDHPSVATTLSNLGAVYSNLGNYQKACEVLERALPIMQRHYGISHLITRNISLLLETLTPRSTNCIVL